MTPTNTTNRRLVQVSMLFLAVLISIATIANPSAALDQGMRGERVFSLKLRNGKITDVLRLLAEEFGLNIIIGEQIAGKVTVDFEGVTLADALNSILKSNGLDYVQEGNILRIEKQGKLEQEKLKKAEQEQKLGELEKETREAEQKKAAAEKELEPLVTKTLKLKYIASGVIAKEGGTSEGDDLQNFQSALENLLSGKEKGGITIVRKTNTLVITDIAQNVDNIIEMAKSLDVPTPQIRIEARVVETSDRDQLEMGIQWGGIYRRDEFTTQGGNVTGGPNVSDGGEDHGRDINRESFAINLPAAVSEGIGGAIDFTIGKLGSRVLDVQLSALEKNDQLKIISRPSILVMQNQNAEIHVGSEVPIFRGFEEETGEAEVEYKKIGIKLGITPQITSEDSIFMTINIEKSAKGDSWLIRGEPFDTIDTKNAFTRVMVKNGETVVIGGLRTKETRKIDSGVPYLSKIPFLGWLFKHKSNDVEDAELLIFITPEIISSVAEAGKIEAGSKAQSFLVK